MLTEAEERYLKTIPEDKVVKIIPYNSQLASIAQSIINKVKRPFPSLKVLFMGASGLGISGQGDIDIYALSLSNKFPVYLPILKQLFGNPNHEHAESVEWEFVVKGHNVEFYLTDPSTESMQRQIRVYEKLKNDKSLLAEYQQLKEEMHGKSLKEYQRKKYEFYNKILNK